MTNPFDLIASETTAGKVSEKCRLDQILVQLGHYDSRSRARDAIIRGAITVNGRLATKPGTMIDVSARISVSDPARDYVSRAALKLKTGLNAFGFDPAERTALDIGASTGGFTQILLEAGADHIIAIDVGHDQMHASLAADPRVTNLEGLNARGSCERACWRAQDRRIGLRCQLHFAETGVAAGACPRRIRRIRGTAGHNRNSRPAGRRSARAAF